MSIIQKLENSYLGILRVVVIAGASLLLIASLALAGWSVQGVLPSPEPKTDAVTVDPRDVLKQVAPEEMKSAQSSVQPASSNAGVKMTNAAQIAASEKLYAMAAAFIGKFSGNVQTINRNGFFEYLDTRLNQYDSDEIRAQYLLGLASAMDASFKSLRVNAIAGSPMPASSDTEADASPVPQVNDKPINMVSSVIGSYTEQFNKKLEAARTRQQASLARMQAEKADAMMQLYVAAGLFGLFLLVVFLSVLIRIERNLREIAGKP